MPFWLPQMDKDIRKPAPEGYISPLTGKAAGPYFNEETVIREPKTKLLKDAINGETHIEISIDQDDEEKTSEKTPLLPKEANPILRFDTPSRRILEFLKNPMENFGRSSSTAYAPPLAVQKRIVIPVRIEPKVFFANERTFLSWLHCILLFKLSHLTHYY